MNDRANDRTKNNDIVSSYTSSIDPVFKKTTVSFVCQIMCGNVS